MELPLNWIARLITINLAWLLSGLALGAEPGLDPPLATPLSTLCPAYSTFEIVLNTGEFADMCFEAEFHRPPETADKLMTENDIDLDNAREILERRPAGGSLFTYYVFEITQVGNLYKGYFVAPQVFRVKGTGKAQVVLEYTVTGKDGKSTRVQLEYQDNSWLLMP